jgi:hypothetical protein
MPVSTPGQYSTFVPSHEATNGLVADFSRNPNDFPLAEYIQYVPVTKTEGRYIRMTVEVAGRLLSATGQNWNWADGTDAPSGNGNLELFEFFSYRTKRKAYPFRMGELAAEQAAWQVVDQHSRIMAQLAMTMRTQGVISELRTSGNWPATNTSTLASAGFSEHDASTTSTKDIKATFDYMADVIRRQTLGAVKPQDLMVVVSPEYARRVSISQEIVDYIKQSETAIIELRDGIGPHENYGLPQKLWQYPIVVEDAVKVSTRKNAAATTKEYVFGADGSGNHDILMLSRPGGLEGVEGAPSFSTATLFIKEEMTVESKHDRDNRLEIGRVVDDWDPQITAPISGFLMQDVLTD